MYPTQVLSDVKTERRWNAECNTMAKKRLDRVSPAVLAESTQVSGLSVQQHNGLSVAHRAALSG